MTRQQHTEILQVVHPICCGLDVHKDSVSACLLHQDEQGELQEEIKEFRTLTDDIYNLKSWLLEWDCPVVALESTGVYWQPIHNVLEDSLEVVLVNARHVKNVPGRKTDISDAKWLAGLLRHGLLRGSYILPKDIRPWQKLWRLRTGLVRQLGDVKRQVHKYLQTCNIKIDSVASDLFSVTGRNLLSLILSDPGEITLAKVEGCCCGTLHKKAEDLYLAIKGFVAETDRQGLGLLMDTVNFFEKNIETLTRSLGAMMTAHRETLDRLDRVPGVNQIGAMGLLSLVGPELSAFPTANHFCSWGGLCPGNNQSAGKRKRGRSPVKDHPLRTLLVELAWAAVKKADSYYRDKYYRLRSRIGPKPAIFAIAHRIGKAIFHIIKGQQEYHELGAQYLDQINRQAKLNRLLRQAHTMGFQLVPLGTA
jgi:transposase